MDFSEQRYQELLAHIFKRFPSVQKAGFGAAAYKPGLERMERFHAALGHPGRAFRAIHVAGTNGKGSVCNLLAAALSAMGLRTGLYTSPHIRDFRERMRIAAAPDGGLPAEDAASWSRMVPKAYVFDFLRRWGPYCEEQDLSFFEITTGMAFRWFADEGAEAAVIETGLGGRLDSTNILTPELSVITSIGFDHCALLGSTLGAIAAEKAGIIKPGVPVVIGERLPETAPVFEAKAREAGSPLIYAERITPRLWERREEILRAMDLQGAYQRGNLRTVLASIDVLREALPSVPDEVLTEALVHAARRMDFHGRWERLSEDPLILCDIGHNAPALLYNFVQLIQMHRPLVIVYGVMADKDLDSILPLMPEAAAYIFAAPAVPRALPAETILQRFIVSGRDPASACAAGSVAEAVRLALQAAGRLDRPVVYIGGSTFVVSEAMETFSPDKKMT